MITLMIGIQARSKSTRLPEKCLLNLGNGKTAIEMIYEKAIKAIDEYSKTIYAKVVILCPEDDLMITSFCDYKRIPWFAGHQDNLWERFNNGIVLFPTGDPYIHRGDGADLIIRLTADCPLIPASLIGQCIHGLLKHDYVSNTVTRTYPDGYDVQGAKREAFNFLMNQSPKTPDYLEHPFKYFDHNLEARVQFENAGFSWQQIMNIENPICTRLTLDTAEDLRRIREILSKRKNG